jgi:hypothetical protein
MAKNRPGRSVPTPREVSHCARIRSLVETNPARRRWNSVCVDDEQHVVAGRAPVRRHPERIPRVDSRGFYRERIAPLSEQLGTVHNLALGPWLRSRSARAE